MIARGRQPVQRHPHERKGRVEADGDRARARGHSGARATCAPRAVVGGALVEGALRRRQKVVTERLTGTTASRCRAALESGDPRGSRAAPHKAATDRLPGRRQSRRRAGNSVCRGHDCVLQPLTPAVAHGRPHKPPVGRACESAPRRLRLRQAVRGGATTTKSRVDQVTTLTIGDGAGTRSLRGETGSGESETPRLRGGLLCAERGHRVGPFRGLRRGRGRGWWRRHGELSGSSPPGSGVEGVRRGRRRAVGGGRSGASETKGSQGKHSERRARPRAFEGGCGVVTAPRVCPRCRRGGAQEG